MRVEFVKAKVQPFAEYPSKKRRRGRPRKEESKKNVGSLIGENQCEEVARLGFNTLRAFEPFNAYTLEWVSAPPILQMENAYKEKLTFIRYVFNKESRKYKALDISGIRFAEIRQIGGLGRQILDIRHIFTNPMACVFLASHILAKFGKGYTGICFRVFCEENTPNKRKTRAFLEKEGAFAMECGYWWDCRKEPLGEARDVFFITPNPRRRDFCASAEQLARCLVSIIKAFNPQQICCDELTIVKGAYSFCCTINEQGEYKINENKVIKVCGARSGQKFGAFYNQDRRRVDLYLGCDAPIWVNY